MLNRLKRLHASDESFMHYSYLSFSYHLEIKKNKIGKTGVKTAYLNKPYCSFVVELKKNKTKVGVPMKNTRDLGRPYLGIHQGEV